MSESEASNWDKKADLVLTSLADLRLSSDGALKAVNELNTKYARSEERQRQVDDKLNELQRRMDRNTQWLMGVGSGIAILFANWAFTALQAANQLPKK